MLSRLRVANALRNKEWDPEGKIDLGFRAAELGGEVGEALNICKKILREVYGLRGSRSTVEALAEELADVIICADLMAFHMGIDLEEAITQKFNATSKKQGLNVYL